MGLQLCSNSLGSTIAGAAALSVRHIVPSALQTLTWGIYGCGCIAAARPLDAAAHESFYRWVTIL